MLWPVTQALLDICPSVLLRSVHKITRRIDEIGRRLVAHAEAGAIREHAGSDVHSEEFLEEKLCGVGDVDL